MNYTFGTYQDNLKTLSFDKMQEIHQLILNDLENDQLAHELYNDLVKHSIKYAEIRSQWLTLTREQKIDMDSLRTSCHNVVIIQFNILSRYLKKQGKICEWRDMLGYEEDDKYNRKTIGDFACYLSFIYAINAR